MSKGTPAEFRRLSEMLDGYCREAGRDPAEIQRSIQFGADALQDGADALIKLSREFVEAGATHLIYTCPIPYSAAGASASGARSSRPPRLTLVMDGQPALVSDPGRRAGPGRHRRHGCCRPARDRSSPASRSRRIDRFAQVGLGTLAVLAALTAATYALDLVATAVGARRFRTSWWSVLGAVAGAMVGSSSGCRASCRAVPRRLRGGAGRAAGRAAGRPRRRRRVARPPPGDRGAPRLVLAMVGLFAVAYLADIKAGSGPPLDLAKHQTSGSGLGLRLATQALRIKLPGLTPDFDIRAGGGKGSGRQ